MEIILNCSSMVPIYEQICGRISQLIDNGELKENSILPSVRGLAAELRISALTVKKAYDLLEERGLVITVHGKGTYVAPPKTDSQAPKAAAEAFRRAAITASKLGLTRQQAERLAMSVLSEIYTEEEENDFC